MDVVNWIDGVSKVFEISDGRGGTVRSFRLYERNDFPESLSTFPSALSYVTDMEINYSTGGPVIELWRGVTEFHIVPSVAKIHYPYVLAFYRRIITAATANMTLGGTVNYFLLRGGGETSIQGPVVLQYGSEEPHLGLIVNWVVKVNATGEFTVSA